MTRAGKADMLIILLHGVGQNGKHMQTVTEMWRDALPNAVFAAPDAPFAYDRGQGRQWFSVPGLTDGNRPRRIAAARSDFDRVIGEEIDKYGFSDRLERVILVAFSQGSMMLIDSVVRGRWPVAGAVAFAGRLTTEPAKAPDNDTRLLLLHGADDSIVSPAELGRAAAILEASGFAVESRLFPDVGHTIAPAAVRAALDFVRDFLAAAASTRLRSDRGQ